jgi:N-acetylglucosamine-6-sulfatase
MYSFRHAHVNAALAALAALTLTALLSIGTGARQPAAAAPPAPNIVLLLLDDARLDDLSAAPSIQRRVAERGATVRNFYSSFPLCCPARATLLTGQYPHNHRVLGNFAPQGGFTKFRDSSTLATWLNPSYRTGLIGKYLNEYKTPYVPPGWDEWMVPNAMYNYTHDKWFIDNGRGGSVKSIPGYQTDTIGSLASSFVTRNAPAAEPYFLYTSIVAPHGGLPADPDDPVGEDVSYFPTPYVKPVYRNSETGTRITNTAFNEADVSDKPIRPAPLTREEIALLTETHQQRREAMRSAEDAVDRILNAVEASGEAANTYVMVMSDNGFILGEHRYRGGKMAPYEVSNHVPFLVRGPGIAPGTALHAPTAQVDFAPTVLAMARRAIPPSVDGVNLLPALRTGVAPSRRGILIEATDTNATTVTPPWLYKGVVSGGWKYVQRTTGKRELYDLRTDRAELTNLAGDPDHAQTQQRLAGLVSAYSGCAGTTCR